METFYKKLIFDLTQLILAKNFSRAITLGKFLLDKGFRTNQLIVSLSYAHKMIYGPQVAIEFLQKYTSLNLQGLEGDRSCYSSSPLISLAFTEYQIERKNLKAALKTLKNMDMIDPHEGNTQDNYLHLLLRSLRDNYSQVLSNSLPTKTQFSQFNDEGDIQKLIQSLLRQINLLTESYLSEKIQYKNVNELQVQQLSLKYGQYYLQYNDIKQRILSLLSENLKVGSDNSPKLKKEQNKQLNTNNKIKKHSTKQLLSIRSKSPLAKERKELSNLNKETNFFQKDKKIQVTIRQNNIEQLQSLLLHVNQFIVFFKNRIKDFGASRIKDVKVAQEQTQGQKFNIN